MRNQRRELAVKERLCDSSARALNASPLGVDQRRLHIRVATTVPHKWNRRERARLDVKRAALATLLRRIIAQTAVGVDRTVVVAKALAAEQSRIHVLYRGSRRLRGD